MQESRHLARQMRKSLVVKILAGNWKPETISRVKYPSEVVVPNHTVYRVWRQIGDKTDHNISRRRSFLIPWKIALRVVVLLSSCRRVLRFVVI